MSDFSFYVKLATLVICIINCGTNIRDRNTQGYLGWGVAATILLTELI